MQIVRQRIASFCLRGMPAPSSMRGGDLGLAIGKGPEHRRPMTRDDALRLRAIDSEIDGHPNPAERFASSRLLPDRWGRDCRLPMVWPWQPG